jgi:hypothetical protein
MMLATQPRRIMGRIMTIGVIALLLGGLAVVPAAAEKPIPDFGSKAAMQLDCETAGGQFHVTEQGNLWCYFPNGSMWICDENGNECTYFPPFTLPPDTHVPVDGGGVLDGGGTDQGGGDQGGVPPSAPIVVPPDDNQPPMMTSPSPGHGKKGKKHSHHGKRH